MTDDMMTLPGLLEKCSDADLLRGMIGFTAERLMALEVQGPTGADHGGRTPARLNQRDGYRDRVWETRAGTVEFRIPKLRRVSYFPGILGTAPDGREGARRRHPGGLFVPPHGLQARDGAGRRTGGAWSE